MLINGEKFACEACVRGHRVSNCQHSDRPLQHINKKGRPVSQCQHCRSMRKSRSAHVKCDCGEKSHKCVHLNGGAEGHKDSCCCNHGGRCTCSHKKELLSLDTVPESESDKETEPVKASKGGVRCRRRANTIHSDGILTFDENGHHKPTYKHAKASQKCGPYQLSRVNSMHGTGSMGNRSADNLLHSTRLGDDDECSDSPTSSGSGSQDQRKTRSETASPLLTGSSNFSQLTSQLPPLDISATEYPQYIPSAIDFFGNLSDHEQPVFSAGLAASVDWSNFNGLEFASQASDNFAPSNYSQPQSFGELDFNGSEQPPTLTTSTSTSGDLSESEELFPAAGESVDFDGGFRNSTASSGYNLGQTQASLLASADLPGLEYEEFKLLKAGNKFLPTPSSLAGDESVLRRSATSAPTSAASFSLPDEEPAFWMAEYHSLPVMQDSPEPGMPSFWSAQ